VSFFFFFQAEDGIRAFHVTGVQTCALPIWIGSSFVARAEPEEFGFLEDGRLLVRGRYTGKARAGDAPLDAEFMHVVSFADGRIRELVQLTDSARWNDALDRPGQVLRTVDFTVTDGLG